MALRPIPDQYHSVQPYLLVDDAAGLIEFIKAMCQRSVEARATSLREPADRFYATGAPAWSIRSATTGGSTRTSRTSRPRKLRGGAGAAQP